VLESDPLEVELVRDVLTQSRQVILVAHEEKFGRRAPHLVTHLDKIDVLITNAHAHERAAIHAPNLRTIVTQ
jgi:DeoR family transcriptional regulator, glycerol-3-phosphate regulon repressor